MYRRKFLCSTGYNSDGYVYSTPTFDLNLTVGSALPAGVTFSRAAVSNGFAGGVLTAFASGQPAMCDNGWLLQPASNNQVRNPRAEGAVVGTPGTLPTNWTKTNSTGLAWNVIGIGTDSGMPYIDVQLVGTPTNTVANWINFEPSPGAVIAAPGDYWCGSVYAKIVAGSTTNLSSYYAVLSANPAGNQYGSRQPNATDPLWRQRSCPIISALPSNVTSVGIGFRVMIAATGVAVNCTFRLACPQLERNSVVIPSSVMLPPAGTPGVSSRGAADQCYFDNITSSWFTSGNGSGTIYTEFCWPATVGFSVFGVHGAFTDGGLFNNSIFNGMLMETQLSSLQEVAHTVSTYGNGSDTTLNLGIANPVAGVNGLTESINKIAISFMQGYFKGSLNGAAPISDYGGGFGLNFIKRLVLFDTVFLPSANVVAGTSFSVLYKRVTYWPQIFSALQLQELTS
jgi:hypothetical protein